MSQQQLLAKVVKTLEDADISYMLTGSIVSSFQGEPRSTHDIDIVVEISADQVHAITSAFPDEHYAIPHPEDTILRKLKWEHDYESEKQFKDALSVYVLQYSKLTGCS